MIRKIKVIGLSCVAVLALGAMSASAAQAANWTVGSAPFTTYATSAAVSNWTMGNGARVLSCGAKFTGTGLVWEAKTSALTVTPEYTGCTSTGGLPTTIQMNGCTYTWTASTLTTGTQTINCPAGKEIMLLVYANETKQKEGITACEASVAAQGPLSGLGFSNQGEKEGRYVAMSKNLSIQAKALKGSKILCGAAAGTSFALTNAENANVTALKNGTSEQTGLWIGS